MLLDKLEKKENFTETEKEIADYLLEHPFDIASWSASMLAKASYTSKAAVFRLCRKLNVESFEDLKRQLEKEARQEERLAGMLEKEPFKKNASIRQIMELLPGLYTKAVEGTRNRQSVDDLKKVVHRLEKTSIIDIYAAGITKSCAEAAQYKFLSIGRNCLIHSSLNEHYVYETGKSSSVAFILSFTGGNPSMVRNAEFLKRHQIFTVGIGGTSLQDLKNACDVYLPVYEEDLILGFEMMYPYWSTTYLLDILFAALTTKDYSHHIDLALKLKEYTEQSRRR